MNMARLPISRAFLRGLRPPPTPRPVPRIAPSASRFQPSAFRPASSTSLSSRVLPRTTPCLPSRPFSSSSRQTLRYGPDRYRRFDQGHQGPRKMPVGEIAVFAIGGTIVFYIYNLETVEATGRRRFNCISHSLELRLGHNQYEGLLRDVRGHLLPEHHPLVQSINGVLQRLIPVAPIEGADWKVHVINDDSTTNAFVLPGGKVFIFTGMLGICEDKDGLAAVLAHEISHVVAHHSGERISNSLLTTGLVLLSALLFDISGQITGRLFDFGFTLPNSRVQEAEADEMGLMMMARACFNPHAAVRLWARMEQVEKIRSPEFMSTHPSNYNRMAALRERLGQAEVLYDGSGCHHIKDHLSPFRKASRPSSRASGPADEGSGSSGWIDEYF